MNMNFATVAGLSPAFTHTIYGILTFVAIRVECTADGSFMLHKSGTEKAPV
jgi:hypothetical protein